MAQFNAGTYEIYWYKDQVDTPNSIQSPTTSNVTSPKNTVMPLKTAAAVGVGLVVARRALNTFRTELIESTGDETLQTGINNIMKGLGYIGTIAAAGPLAGGVLVATDVALNSISYNRSFKRQDTLRRLESELLGKRANIASGGAYYD